MAACPAFYSELATKVMSSDSICQDRGDILFPEEMRPLLKRSEPFFANMNMVIIGSQGSGKTSLFNKLTNADAPTSNGIETCTRKNQLAKALGRASGLNIIDTPGVALDGVPSEDLAEVQKALTMGNVSQIVAVQGLPSSTRETALDTDLEPLDKIMSCDTFHLDPDGFPPDIFPSCVPLRTRVFLVLTHRDSFKLPRAEWQLYVNHVRQTFPWIGPVAIIDEFVTVEWLYSTVILCAGLAPLGCIDHHIPDVELFSKFSVKTQLTNVQQLIIDEEKKNLMAGISAAQRFIDGETSELNDTEEQRCRIASVISFLECLYEGRCDAVMKRVGLRGQMDPGELPHVVHYKLGPWFQEMKMRLRTRFPEYANTAALYKKCPRCGCMYSRKELGNNRTCLGECPNVPMDLDSCPKALLYCEIRTDNGRMKLTSKQSSGDEYTKDKQKKALEDAFRRSNGNDVPDGDDDFISSLAQLAQVCLQGNEEAGNHKVDPAAEAFEPATRCLANDRGQNLTQADHEVDSAEACGLAFGSLQNDGDQNPAESGDQDVGSAQTCGPLSDSLQNDGDQTLAETGDHDVASAQTCEPFPGSWQNDRDQTHQTLAETDDHDVGSAQTCGPLSDSLQNDGDQNPAETGDHDVGSAQTCRPVAGFSCGPDGQLVVEGCASAGKCSFLLHWNVMFCATRNELKNSSFATAIPADIGMLSSSEDDTDPVLAWLQQLQLSEHWDVFQKKGVNKEMLKDLTEDQLKELGVSNPYHVKKLIKYRSKLL